MPNPSNPTQILIRLKEQGSHFCPICRHDAKHLASIHCLDNFWRMLIERQVDATVITRTCGFYYGAPLMNIYTNEELGYAVACLHYALAMLTYLGDTRFFWKYIIDFLEADVIFREVAFERAFFLVLHVIESLAWTSKNGKLFPMPAIVWYLIDGFIIRNKHARKAIADLQIKEFRWLPLETNWQESA